MFLGLLTLLMLGPIGMLAFGDLDLDTPWHLTSRKSTMQAPDPAVERGAVVQVYGARIVRWRGAFGIHPWIAVKRAGAERYTTYHIVGWRARHGGDALVASEVDTPDTQWFGAYPQLLADHRGAQAEALIDHIESAVAAYPWRASPLARPQQQQLRGLGGPAGARPAVGPAAHRHRQGLPRADHLRRPRT